MSFEEVRFPSQGASLYGRLYRPADAGAAPAVAMAHGTSATIAMTADKYAEAFARRGVAALVYDHINLGKSGGEPRQEINPWMQARGYLDALTFLEHTPGIDAQRLAVWGDSYSGGGVLTLGPCDARIRAVVAQVPICGVDPPARAGTADEMAALTAFLRDGDVKRELTVTGPLPVVSFDQAGTPSLLLTISAFRWFIEYGGRHGTAWVNRVTRVVPKTVTPFSPWVSAAFMQCPVLMVCAAEDEFPYCNVLSARATLAMMPSLDKHILEVDGGHFGLLHCPSELFDIASRAQADFLARVLGA